MTEQIDRLRWDRARRWRIARWSGYAFLLLLPLIAMQLTREVNWDETDFIVFGAMLAVAGGMFELAARMSGPYRLGAAIAILAAFLLVWVNLAVGFLGSEDNPANLMFGGVFAVAILGGFIGRFKAAGMARAMVAAAVAQLLVGVVALALRLGSPGFAGWYEVFLGTSMFGTLWLLSAWQFRRAAEKAGAH